MNQKRQSVVLTGLLVVALGLGACSSMQGDSDTSAGSSGSSGTSGTGASGSDSANGSSYDQSSNANGGSAGTGMVDGAGMAGQGASATAPNWSPNATVVAIEVLPRGADGAAGASAGGSAAMGNSGTGGATGSSSGSERIYRVTLRLDDGSTAVVTQDTMPTFRSGDRVALPAGMIQR